MEGFKVTTTLGQADWQALTRALTERANDRLAASGFRRWVPAALWFAAATLVVVCMQLWPRLVQPGSLLASLVLFFALAWAIGMRQRRAYRPADDGAFLGTTEFVFEPTYFEVTRAHSKSRNEWTLVRDVSQTATHVMLWIDHVSAYTFRVADLLSPLTVQDAVTRLRSFVVAARAAAGVTTPAVSSREASTSAPLLVGIADTPAPTIRQEFGALLRLETHRSVHPAHLYGRDLTLLLLASLAFGLWVGLSRLDYPDDVQFMWYSLPSTSVFVVGALLLAWSLSRFSSPPVPMRRTLLLVLAAAPVFTVAAYFAEKVGTFGIYGITVLVGMWIAFLWMSGLRVMTGMRQFRAFLAAGACCLLMIVASSHMFISPGLWYQADDEFDPSSEESAAREELLFEQATRIDMQIAAMPPGEPQHAAMYFVGFAGYGEQRVFAEEIGTAARTVAAAFDTGKRQLLLVNDRRDTKKYPLASVAALRHALISLGRRMNRDEDVLFLALSSHGSEDATISVSSETMMYWRDLSASDLRAMLDESGIRWKVVVISACHAGSFIESLADDHTIVLTAAARENSSFGCSDDRDLTYFGEAFYKDALPRAASLRAAFESASAAIGKREDADGVDASDPQAHFGVALEEKLTERYSSSVAPIR
jgi:Peptidase C13 family